MSPQQTWDELLTQIIEDPDAASWRDFRHAFSLFYGVAQNDGLSLRILESKARKIDPGTRAWRTWGDHTAMPAEGPGEVKPPRWRDVEVLARVWVERFFPSAQWEEQTRVFVRRWADAYWACGGNAGPHYPRPAPTRTGIGAATDAGTGGAVETGMSSATGALPDTTTSTSALRDGTLSEELPASGESAVSEAGLPVAGVTGASAPEAGGPLEGAASSASGLTAEPDLPEEVVTQPSALTGTSTDEEVASSSEVFSSEEVASSGLPAAAVTATSTASGGASGVGKTSSVQGVPGDVNTGELTPVDLVPDEVEPPIYRRPRFVLLAGTTAAVVLGVIATLVFLNNRGGDRNDIAGGAPPSTSVSSPAAPTSSASVKASTKPSEAGPQPPAATGSGGDGISSVLSGGATGGADGGTNGDGGTDTGTPEGNTTPETKPTRDDVPNTTGSNSGGTSSPRPQTYVDATIEWSNDEETSTTDPKDPSAIVKVYPSYKTDYQGRHSAEYYRTAEIRVKCQATGGREIDTKSKYAGPSGRAGIWYLMDTQQWVPAVYVDTKRDSLPTC
ncbi:hypothetical protein R2B67_35855 [Streptomyces cyaneofuscatus]|uniref:hypothetical protein n=1 Tax=Streptomyces cyaneofuscatus TaxID=66883 RepID=UPI002952E23D|nr:hypothetical protein [Streptomyces cyaneofuscatus]WOP13589.1 hypothetical protein R2B67_35855 [Streptomyces cyaneofuscatus]